MRTEKVEHFANELFQALRSSRAIQPLTKGDTEITVKDAYHISRSLLGLRIENSDERVVGKKIGITSAAVQEMLGVFQPDFGFLTDAMACDEETPIQIAGNLIQPRAEGEIAFRLVKDLVGPGVAERDVLEATGTIMPCFEIVDSRIVDWDITIADTVADNASCGIFILGKNEVAPQGIDLPNLKMLMYKNGKMCSEGLGSAVQGNPLTAVAWLANTLGEFGIPLEAGEVILSGSLTSLVPVSPGDSLVLDLQGIGTVSCSFV